MKPNVVLEAFEARATRMSVTCAKNLSKFENPEEGMLSLPQLGDAFSVLLFYSITCHSYIYMIGKFLDIRFHFIFAQNFLYKPFISCLLHFNTLLMFG